ncbi:MAG: FkbM family methyltransferase [Rickettsiales bacterium]|jgi:FkbM family methyltransferase|nr:FkbM family methyltransferase [Rickettsiales bacterium]
MGRIKKAILKLLCFLIPSKRIRHAVRRELNISVREKFVMVSGTVGVISWSNYMLEHNMPEKVAALRHGLDAESNATIDRFFKYMTILPENCYGKYKVLRKSLIDSRATPEEWAAMKTYEANLEQYRRDYLLDKEDDRYVDVFLTHTGLAGTNRATRDYIAGKDFIDGGAYIGDSALVYIKNYNPKKVWSFEISPKNLERYPRVMKMNGINKDKYELVPMGISSEKGIARFDDYGGGAVSLKCAGDTETCLVDLDSFTRENNLKVGYIKTDIEGAGLDALMGMWETIGRDRPVLTLSIYHSPIEFFEMKPYLEEIVKDINYTIMIRKYHPYPDVFSEIAIFAYPRELE